MQQSDVLLEWLKSVYWQWFRKCFFRIKTFFVFQDKKLKLSVSIWNWILWTLTKFQHIQLIQTIVIFIFSICHLIEFKFCEVSQKKISNRFWKFPLSILKNKKYFLSRFQYQNKKALFTGSIFREGFDLTYVVDLSRYSLLCY